MNCSHCESPNPPHAAWCQSCGCQLGDAGGTPCRRCGARLPRSARYCVACGAPREAAVSLAGAGSSERIRRLVPPEYLERLLSASRSVSGSRRTVTMLFFDVTGSTAMFERRDPEEVMEVMNAAFAALMPPIYRHGGTLARLMGDGVLAFFGAPLAHEDDPGRACAAALEILAAADEFGGRLEAERGIAGFAVRVGLNTGNVVVGEVGDDHRVEYTAMGDAVNVAARLESSAAAGTILVSEETRTLAPDYFRFEPMGEVALKGREEPVAAWRLSGRRPKKAAVASEPADWDRIDGDWRQGGADRRRAEALVQSRIDRLPAPSRRVLLTASVIDAPFDRTLLARSLRFDAGGDALDDALAPLAAEGFIVGEANDSLLRISYPVVREVAYGSLLKSHRKLLHRRVAAAMEPGADGGTPDIPERGRDGGDA